jgi:2-oxo-4-hydroxy-4-carboxy-5-ureidoimidazoline decarboxylase
MGRNPIPLSIVNKLSEDAFIENFGDVAEHSPWVAAEAAGSRPYGTREGMIGVFQSVILRADKARQTALLRAHPDLAGRAAVAGHLTDESKREQAGVGLDRLTREEFQRFNAMNDAYRRRHNIPFIFAVRGATKHDILAAFVSRLKNAPDVEFVKALEQVGRIIRFRLEDRVAR